METIIKICENCQVEFLISKEAQMLALEKGGELNRRYCNKCLLRWRKKEITLE